jgi:hypothetical protein
MQRSARGRKEVKGKEGYGEEREYENRRRKLEGKEVLRGVERKEGNAGMGRRLLGRCGEGLRGERRCGYRE